MVLKVSEERVLSASTSLNKKGSQGQLYRIDRLQGLDPIIAPTQGQLNETWKRLNSFPTILYKRYLITLNKKTEKITGDICGHESSTVLHLNRLIDLYRTASQPIRDTLDEYSAWPIAAVYRGHACTGFLMPDVNLDNHNQPARPCQFDGNEYTTAAELSVWLRSTEAIQKNRLCHYFPLSREDKTNFTFSALTYVNTMHTNGLIIGDLSSRNILAYVPNPNESRQAQARIHFIEVDTTRFIDSGPAMPQRETPKWIPPEHGDPNDSAEAECSAEGRYPTTQTDVWKLALLILRLSDPEDHVFRTQYDHPDEIERMRNVFSDQFGAYSESFVDMVFQAFSDYPQNRPSITDLYDEFTNNCR